MYITREYRAHVYGKIRLVLSYKYKVFQKQWIEEEYELGFMWILQSSLNVSFLLSILPSRLHRVIHIQMAGSAKNDAGTVEAEEQPRTLCQFMDTKHVCI